jgi:glycosyltransferase involved in cell wall biosynthesis
MSQWATLVANSHSTAHRMEAIGVPRERIVVKYLGVPVLDICPSHPADGELKILFLGRLVDFKGPEHVIRAFEQACDRGLRARLLMAGDGPLRGECEAIVKTSAWRDRFEILGAVTAEHGDALRQASHIFTTHNVRGPQSGQEEAYGVALAEAQAAGLPIVSTRSGSVPELVEDDHTGLLVEPGNVEGHADTLLMLANQPELRLTLCRAGWARARERFSEAAERQALRALFGIAR